MTERYSIDHLKQFLALAGEKGWLNPTTAKACESAANRVLGVLGESEVGDVRTVDIDESIRRFANLNPGVSGDSLNAYASRLKKAIQYFDEWKADPTAWKPPTRTGRKRTTESGERARRKSPSSKGPMEKPVRLTAPEASSSHQNLTYPFPLRPDLTVSIANVPRDLKVAECDRIAAFLRALCIDQNEKSPRSISEQGLSS